jgi:hypothetical protein
MPARTPSGQPSSPSSSLSSSWCGPGGVARAKEHGDNVRLEKPPLTYPRAPWNGRVGVLVVKADSLAPGGSVARREAFLNAHPQFDPHDVMIVDCCAGVSESIWPLTNIASLRRRSA